MVENKSEHTSEIFDSPMEYAEEEYYQEDEKEKITSNSNEFNFQIIRKNELLKQREAKIEEIMNNLYLSREEAISVLIGFRWNVEKFTESWYDNVERNRIKFKVDEDPIKKRIIQDLIEKKKETGCRICIENKTGQYFALKCGHSFCYDCWTEYLDYKSDDVNNLLFTTCPQNECNLIIPEDILAKFLPGKTDALNKAIIKNFTDSNANIKWCPTPECGNCIQSNVVSIKDVECDCKAIFCFACSKEGHRPCHCDIIDHWLKKNNSEAENVKWLMVNTKQCPSCRKFIEKNQGCNHMTCRKEAAGCGYEFCWICLGEWASHNKDYYNCNQFDANKIKEKENERKNAKLELEKYVFYFDRYMNHEKSMALGVKMRVTMKETIKNINSKKLIPYDDLKFLEDAIEIIIRSRRSLKNTYVFGYFLKDDCKEKKLFEYSQFLLERNADRLHELLENDSINNLMKIVTVDEFNKEWNKYKGNVINLTTVTVNYQEKLLSEIENTMLDLVNYSLII